MGDGDEAYVLGVKNLAERIEVHIAFRRERNYFESCPRALAELLPRDEVRMMLKRCDGDGCIGLHPIFPRAGDHVDGVGCAACENDLVR